MGDTASAFFLQGGCALARIRQRTMAASIPQDDERLRKIEERTEQEDRPLVHVIMDLASKGLEVTEKEQDAKV